MSRMPAFPAPTELMAGSRLNQMGFNGYTGSDGVSTGSNSRIYWVNETGAIITKMRVYYPNWMITVSASNNTDGFNSITVSGSIEYPSGTFNQVTFSASATAAIAANANALESDEITLSTPIPVGAIAWFDTFVTVAATAKWPTGYLIQTASPYLEASDVTASDKTMVGGIVNVGGNRGYGPIAAKATAFTGTPLKFALIGLGDSIIMGSGDVLESAALSHGNMGFAGKAASTRVPYLNLGISGSAIQQNTAANFAKTLDLISKLGPVVVLMDWGTNDLQAGQTAAQIETNYLSVAGSIKALTGVKRVVPMTFLPRTTSTTSVTLLTSSGTTATATVADTSGLQTGEKVLIAGASPAAYNGTYNVTVISPTQFTYVFAGGTTPATGTITANDNTQSGVWQNPVLAAFAGGGASQMGIRNAAIRAKPSYADDVLEASDAVSTSRDSGVWLSGGGGTIGTHIPGSKTGTVTSGTSTTVFASDATTAYTSFYFGGQVLFLTGANAGLIRAVNSNTTAGSYTLGSALSFTPSAGDTFIVFPTNMAATSDNIHPVASNTAAPGQGGVYLLKDALNAKLTTWLAR